MINRSASMVRTWTVDFVAVIVLKRTVWGVNFVHVVTYENDFLQLNLYTHVVCTILRCCFVLIIVFFSSVLLVRPLGRSPVSTKNDKKRFAFFFKLAMYLFHREEYKYLPLLKI